ncbi:translation initiation factor IF-3 [bacterium]
MIINEMIRFAEVRVVADKGEQLGIMSSEEALKIAQERDMDLFLLSAKAKPPVCRIMDYGKYRYEQEKQKKEAKKKQKQVQLKEIKMRPKIGEHDLIFKVNHMLKFLKEGDKVKASIMFYGRERAHFELGYVIMNKIMKQTDEFSTVEKGPQVMGNAMVLILAPKQ